MELGAGLFSSVISSSKCRAISFLSESARGGWIARIMVFWGIVSMGIDVHEERDDVLRHALSARRGGGGLFSGVILYLTYWYSDTGTCAGRWRCSRWAASLAGVIGSPISGGILCTMHGFGGLAGWQWLFLLRSHPRSAAGALSCCSVLPNGPQERGLAFSRRKACVRDRRRRRSRGARPRTGASTLQGCLRERSCVAASASFTSC